MKSQKMLCKKNLVFWLSILRVRKGIFGSRKLEKNLQSKIDNRKQKVIEKSEVFKNNGFLQILAQLLALEQVLWKIQIEL